MSRNNQVDLWEAWVDLQVIGNKQLITLYVLGEVSSLNGSLPALIKRSSKSKTNVLSLDLHNADEDDKSIEELELGVRAYNCLKNANIYTLKDLVMKTESDLLKTKHFGRKSLQQVKHVLESMGLSLGMEV